jgi:hypothetical protein
MLPVNAFQKRGRHLGPLWGDDGGGAPTNTTTTTSNISPFMEPYVNNYLNAAQDQIYTTNAAGDINGFQPYKAFGETYDAKGNRTNTSAQAAQAAVAGFSPLQQQAQSSAANLQRPGQYANATNATQGVMNQLGNASYNPQTGGFMATSAPNLRNFTMDGPNNVTGATAQAAQAGAAPQAQAAGLGATPEFGGASFGGPRDVSSSSVNAQNLNTYQMGNVGNVSAPGMQTTNMTGATTNYAPGLNAFQMGPASQVSTQDFTQPGTAQQYMNPYLQASLDPQLKEIQRQYDITGQEQQGRATQAGAFGGSREALMAAENARNKNTAMNSAITQGYNNAFQNAQSQFNAQQQANLQAQQANQQAGLTVGGQNLASQLGVQQLGTQTGLQTALANLSNEQQANVQNQAAQLQASGMNAQQAMQAALANQTMNYNVGNTNLQSQLATQQLGSGQNLQAQLANQQSGLQAGLANQNMGYNTALQNAQLRQQAGLANQALAGQYGLTQGQFNQAANLANQQMAGQYGLANLSNQQAANLANQQSTNQANLANQNMGFNTQNANLQSLLGVQSLGSGQNMQSQLANQGAFGQAQQLAANQQQFGANNRLANLQAQLGAANQLAGIGGAQLAADQGILNTQAAQGALQQQNQQNILNQQIQNYATQQQYPFMQLGLLNSLTRGLPMQSSSTQMYQAQPNIASQVAGLGAAGVFGGKASGGLLETKKYAPGGLIPVNMMNNQQLQAMQKSPAVDLFGKMSAASQQGLNQYISSNPQAINVLAAKPTELPPLAPPPQDQQPQGQQGQPQGQQPGLPDPGQVATAAHGGRIGLHSIATGDMTKMAGGGILAFADGEEVPPPAYEELPMDAKGNVDMAKLAPMVWNMRNVRDASDAGVKELRDAMAKQKENEDSRYYRRLGLGMAEAPSRTGHGFSDLLSNVAHGWGAAEAGQAKDDADALASLKAIANFNIEGSKADETRRGQLLGNILNNETSRQNKELSLQQIANSKEIMSADKAAERERLYQSTALKVYQDTKVDIYNKLITAHPEMEVEEAKRQADTEAFFVMKQSPLFKYLNLEKPAAAPPPAPAKPGFFESLNLFGPNATVPKPAAPTAAPAAAAPTPANTNSLYYQLKQQRG